MKLICFTVFLLFTPLLFVGGCSSETAEEETEVSTPVHDVRGRIIFIDENNESITIVHEEIPDVMQAMRMSLRLDNPGEVANIERGDIVSFQMTRRGASWYAYGFSVLPDTTELQLPELLHQIDPG
jgi:Cu/Ag efflux protein CusF